MQETGAELFSLPLSAVTLVPHITNHTPQLDFQRCFLDYPYTLDANLSNDSEYMVKYQVLDQSEQSCMSYSTPIPRGVIQPHSTLQLPLQVKARQTGELFLPVPIHILHSLEPPVVVRVQCIGQGPVLYGTPDSLDFGVGPVLAAISRTVVLSNHSLIPADFECVLVS